MVSPRLLNTARFGYSRAGYFFTGEPTPGTPAADVPGFLTGKLVGAVVVGGSAASNPQAQIGLAGSNNGSNLNIDRNLYTYEDRVALTHGAHQLSFGAWFQQFQSNETDQPQPVRPGYLCQPADISYRHHQQLLVQPCADRDELAIAVRSRLRTRRDSPAPSVHSDPWVPG